jgi:predicted AlkP superfamily phosphohydrolase/phosphomutase
MPWFVLPTYSDGHIRLNVAGRERDGVIAVDDYDRQCDELESWLRAATDPRSGEPVVDEVLRLRAEAPLAADGPGADLVVTWRAPVDALVHPQTGCIGPFAFPRSGSHTVAGFLIATGGGVPHATLAEHDMLDVPPTLLTLLGWPVPPRVTGEPIPEIVRSPASDSPS